VVICISLTPDLSLFKRRRSRINQLAVSGGEFFNLKYLLKAINMSIKLSFSLLFMLLFLSCKFSPEKETNRPFIHFTTLGMKDGIPSALVHDGKEYHLFYQGKTDSISTQWEQTTSTDLVHWNKPAELTFPDATGNVNSASFVIDWNNTSGLAKDGQPPLISIYQTAPENFQYLAYSYDFGKTWTKYTENTISLNTGDSGYRISKIIWHEESQKWILVLTGRDHVRFYSSENLIDWQFNSTFTEVLDYISGEWDYTDFFPLIAEGSNETKWILMVSYNSGNPSSGAGTRSIVGNFNGFTFQPVHEKIKSVDYGSDNFAGVTCNLNSDCFHIGCISHSTETGSNSNTFTLPRKLSLSRNFNGYIIKSAPSEEIIQLRGKKKLIEGADLKGVLAVNEKQTLPYEINLTFNINKLQWLNFAEKFGVELFTDQGDRMTVAYNHSKRVFYIDRLFSGTNNQMEKPLETDYAPFIANGETLDLRIIVDHNSVELFSGNDCVVMTEKISPDKVFHLVKIFAEGGEITLKGASIYRLKMD
jgi:fructan beta-fructosidase